MSRYAGVDFLEFDSLLSEEETMVRDTVRGFVEDRIKPIIEECHREGSFPMDLVPAMGIFVPFVVGILFPFVVRSSNRPAWHSDSPL